MSLKQQTIAANGLSFTVTTTGTPSPMRAPVLFLHGFPEHRGAWDDVLPALSHDRLCIAPDQRGYGTTSKPEGVASYHIKHLTQDMLALMEIVAPGQPFDVVAHDWGASVGYALAFAAPQRVQRLAVINGVHPVLFQTAILTDPAQRAASQYFHYLRAPVAEAKLSENGFRKLEGFLTRFGNNAWLTPEKRERYHQAWREPDALTAMLNWYRATPITVPSIDEVVDTAMHLRFDPQRFKVSMPHLVVWGMDDPALQLSSRAGLAAFAPGVVVVEIAGADHWVVHQRTPEVIAALERFLV